MVLPGSRVLDVGCGTGATLKELRDAVHCEVVGIEPHPRRAQAARDDGLDVRDGLLSDYSPEGLGRFDAVLLLDVLEHLADPVELLQAVKPWLRPQGALVASVPNVGHWTVRLDLLRGRFDYTDAGIMDATHLRWFTRESFRRLFETNGYRITAERSSSGTWLPVYGRSAPWRWLGSRRRARLIHGCKRRWPGLFGCQHIVRAVLA